MMFFNKTLAALLLAATLPTISLPTSAAAQDAPATIPAQDAPVGNITHHVVHHVHHVVHHVSHANRRAAPERVASRGFAVSPGDDLHETLTAWARTSGWTLVWDSDFTYQIAGHASFSGDFVDAVGALMAAMQEARPAPAAEIYRANHVIVVKDGLTATR